MANNKKWYQQSEMVVALSAIVVSVVAVVVGVYSAWIDRSFARASTWPHIEIFRSYSDQPASFRIQVSNQGTGPAIVHYAIVEHDGKRYRTWRDWLEAQYSESTGSFSQSHIGTRVLSAEQIVTPLEVSSSALAKAIRIDDKMNLTLCYCSVFEECWVTDRSNEKLSTPHCEVPSNTPFEQ